MFFGLYIYRFNLKLCQINHFLHIMIKRGYLFIFLISLIFISCETPFVQLSPARYISGTYHGKYLNFAGSLVPLPLVTGNSTFDLKFLIKERSEERVDVLLELTENNGSDFFVDSENFAYLSVKKNPAGGFELSNDSTIIGSINKNDLEFLLEYDGMSASVTATKDQN